MGLTQYNPFEMVNVSRGHMTYDHNWIRFNNENLTLNDIDNCNYTKWGECDDCRK